MRNFLLKLADAAAKESLPRFRKSIFVENKEADHPSDSAFDPVTEADKAAEVAIRNAIRTAYPNDAIIGEEDETENPDAENGWIIDPIDGTRAFISGVPVWGTLIGRFEGDSMTAGIMHQPFTGEAYVADGKTSVLMHNGQQTPLKTNNCTQLKNAKIMTTSPRSFNAEDLTMYDRLEAACQLPRYGGDCYAYALLASGHIDLVMEADLKPYDIAALVPIIEQAGGVVRSWDGGSANQGGRVLAAANEDLFQAAFECIHAS